jgi:DHA1 family multidrug resistance protein-like MFS transporter
VRKPISQTSLDLKEGKSQKNLTISRKYVFVALALSFIVNFDSNAAIPIIANYSIDLGASALFMGFIVGIYSMFHIFSNLIFGRLVDKFGRKRLIAFGVFLDGVSLLLYALAQDPYFLLFGRIIHGIGGGFGGPATMAYISDATSQRRSGRGMALYGMSIGFSNLIGFLVGGMVAQIIGESNLFFIIAIILFVMSFTALLLPSIYQPTKEKVNLRNEIKQFKKIIFRRTMISPYFSMLAMMFNMGIVTTVYTFMLENEKYLNLPYTTGQIGMILSIMVIFSILIHYPAGKLSDKIGYVKVMLIGLLLIASAFGVFMISLEVPIPMIGMTLLGVGHGLIFPSSAGLVREKTKGSESGVATGTFYALIVAGVAIGGPVSGFTLEIYNAQFALALGIVVPLIMFIVLVVLLIFLKKD